MIDQGLSLTVRNRRGYTPLHFAVQQGSRAAVELLLRKGADVMVRMVRVTSSGWQDGWTPLHLAAYSGYAAIAEVLVEESAEVNAASANGITPLLLAAAGDHIQSEQIVRFLLDHDADVNAASVNGWTALYAAAQTENFEVAQLLLEHGADVNAVYEDGATPLHRAVENTNVRMIELFLEHGAEVNALNKRGQTPLDYLPEDAPNTIAQEISELLRQHGATEGKNHAVIVTPDEQEQFVLWDRSETMTLPRALIEAGINVDENPRISVSRPGGRIHVNIRPYREILQREGDDVEVESGSEIKLHAK